MVIILVSMMKKSLIPPSNCTFIIIIIIQNMKVIKSTITQIIFHLTLQQVEILGFQLMIM